MTDDAKIPAGSVGDNIATAVREIREAKRLPYTELSERLTELGRPIPVLGLRRIEKGERRVDVDDLVALARALGVPPVLLAFPLGRCALTSPLPGKDRPTWLALKWFIGDAAFPAEDAAPYPGPLIGTRDDNQAWATGARPLVFHRDHDRLLDSLRAESGRVPIIQDAVDRAASDAERIEHQRRVNDAQRQVGEVENQLAQHRRHMRELGIKPPLLPESLRYLDREDR